MYLVGPSFHSLKVASIYIHIFFKWQNIYLYSFFSILLLFFCRCDHIFVLSNQNSALAGHTSFREKKCVWSPEHFSSFCAFQLHYTNKSNPLGLFWLLLAPVTGMNNLTTLLCNNLWQCHLGTIKKPLWGKKTGNVFPKPMQRHKLSRVSCFKTIVIPKKENKTFKSQLMLA